MRVGGKELSSLCLRGEKVALAPRLGELSAHGLEAWLSFHEQVDPVGG
jgi:hypothetical protein